MKQELARGCRILQAASAATLFEYHELFRTVDMNQHSHLLRLVMSAGSENQLRRWTAWTEAKVRSLLLDLETTEHVMGVRPYPEHPDKKPDTNTICIGLEFVMEWSVMSKPRNIKLQSKVDEFVRCIKNWRHFDSDMAISVETVSYTHLTLPTKRIV
eukprot:TRINITY_DN40158_c0_g1_i2.p1 TRINITY_DN40158_c0_g1~~TRINITY_DN40158_c0_g1_i2.p1  ORF type:complete len:157 (+),score=27.55 TRINITY_DN40158_c0_g1_i2:215-685(+)